MAVSVSRDLSVRVTADVNADKLADRQQALRESVQKGEPKALGVSQVMLGLMVMSYSIPLLFTDFTEVVNFGVPWWSGLSFIAAGAVAIVMEKHTSIKLLGVCLLVTLAAILLSILALVFYVVDLHKDRRSQLDSCITNPTDFCEETMSEQELSRGVKSCLLFFTFTQTTLASVLSVILFKERRRFGRYTSLSQGVPESPTTDTIPDLN